MGTRPSGHQAVHCRPRVLPAQPCSKVPTLPSSPSLPPSPPPGQQLCLLPLEATAHVSLRQPPLRRLGLLPAGPPSQPLPSCGTGCSPDPTQGKSTQAPAWPATLVAQLPPIPARRPSTPSTFRGRPAGPRAPARCSLGCVVSGCYKHSSSCVLPSICTISVGIQALGHHKVGTSGRHGFHFLDPCAEALASTTPGKLLVHTAGRNGHLSVLIYLTYG